MQKVAAVGALLLSSGCASAYENRYGDSLDVSSYPPEIQKAYRVFAVRCSRCHTLARPLNANIRDPEHWVRYVARMRLQPGSGINHTNADTILRFLLFYTAELNGDGAGGEHDVSDEAADAPPGPAAPPETSETGRTS